MVCSFLLLWVVLQLFMHASTNIDVGRIRNIIKKGGTFGPYHYWVKELEYRPENNAAMTNIVNAPRGRMERSSTVLSGSGFNFQSDKQTWRNCIMFVYVYLKKESQ